MYVSSPAEKIKPELFIKRLEKTISNNTDFAATFINEGLAHRSNNKVGFSVSGDSAQTIIGNEQKILGKVKQYGEEIFQAIAHAILTKKTIDLTTIPHYLHKIAWKFYREAQEFPDRIVESIASNEPRTTNNLLPLPSEGKSKNPVQEENIKKFEFDKKFYNRLNRDIKEVFPAPEETEEKIIREQRQKILLAIGTAFVTNNKLNLTQVDNRLHGIAQAYYKEATEVENCGTLSQHLEQSSPHSRLVFKVDKKFAEEIAAHASEFYQPAQIEPLETRFVNIYNLLVQFINSGQYSNKTCITSDKINAINKLTALKEGIDNYPKTNNEQLLKLMYGAIEALLIFIKAYSSNLFARMTRTDEKENYLQFINELNNNLIDISIFISKEHKFSAKTVREIKGLHQLADKKKAMLEKQRNTVNLRSTNNSNSRKIEKNPKQKKVATGNGKSKNDPKQTDTKKKRKHRNKKSSSATQSTTILPQITKLFSFQSPSSWIPADDIEKHSKEPKTVQMSEEEEASLQKAETPKISIRSQLRFFSIASTEVEFDNTTYSLPKPFREENLPTENDNLLTEDDIFFQKCEKIYIKFFNASLHTRNYNGVFDALLYLIDLHLEVHMKYTKMYKEFQSYTNVDVEENESRFYLTNPCIASIAKSDRDATMKYELLTESLTESKPRKIAKALYYYKCLNVYLEMYKESIQSEVSEEKANSFMAAFSS